MVTCWFDVIAPEGGSFSKIVANVVGHEAMSSNDGCSLAYDLHVDGATLSNRPLYSDTFEITGIADALSPGSKLFSCEGFEHVQPGEGELRDFSDVQAWSDTALDGNGGPVLPPKLCIANIRCSSRVYGFDFKGAPHCGDANYDTRVTALAAIAALRKSTGLPSCNPVPTSCDANGDGSVNAVDALSIIRFAVEAPVTLACPVPCNENWAYELRAIVQPQSKSDLFVHVVPSKGRFVARPGIPTSHQVSYAGDGTADVQIFASDKNVMSFLLRLEVDGYRPSLSDIQIDVRNGEGAPVEGAIASLEIDRE